MAREEKAGLNFFSDKQKVTHYLRDVREVIQEAQRYVKKVEARNLNKISIIDLKKLMQEAFSLGDKLFAYYLACQPQTIRGIEDKIIADLTKLVGASKVSKVFITLTRPIQISSVRKEELSWLKILKKFRQSGNDLKVVSEMINRHQKSFCLMAAADGAVPLTKQDYLDQLIADTRPQPMIDKEIIQIENESAKLNREKGKIITRYQLPGTLISLCETLAQISHWRLEMRVRGWVPHYVYIARLLDALGRRLNIPSSDLGLLTVDELWDAVASGEVDPQLLTRRREAFLALIENGKIKYFDGIKARGKFSELVSEEKKNTNTVHGRVAQPGRLTGQVLVYRWGDKVSDCLSRMTDNTVLVAGQTRPQLMPLIKKAVAIVTDEGGITSHAAIVSRELGKPCVIGTGNATQILKDGMMVEVDAMPSTGTGAGADKGIVRIIK
ncbi:MAG: hypothetical protein HYT46_00595 [Candidatus Vogelbacteria bacterium]|nr:hypothetical protein [Candidatus Vogelbacteria bacterium]